MEAIVLVWGLGTRLRQTYADRPKALVPVAGRPMLAWLIDMLRDAGVRHVHLATSYMGDAIEEWVAKRADPDMAFTLSKEPRPLGTAGALELCRPYIDTSPFLVLNGDSLIPNLSVQQFIEGHHDTEATLAAVKVPNAGRFGTVEFDEEGLVQDFREKSADGEGFVNGGVYLLTRELFERVPPGEPLSIEKDVFPQLASQGQLRAVEMEGPLLDMGTPEGLDQLNDYLKGPG